MATEQLFVSIVIILVAARILGELFQRIKQPPLVGELLAGVVIGPSLLGLVLPSTDLQVLSDLAVFFLMFLAGLEMDPKEIRRAGRSAIVISLVAFFIPLLAGTGVASLFGLTIVQSLFMGLLLSITAVPVSAIVLMQFGILNSRLGNTVMTAAVINDILSLIVLSIILQIHTAEGTGAQVDFENVGWSGAKIAAFLGGIFLFDILFRKTSSWLPSRVEPFFKKYLQTKEAAFGILLITTIAISLIAQDIGLHFVIGTFFSGLVVYKEMIGRQNFNRVYGIISAITFGFFAPIFFALIGIEFNVQSLINAVPLFFALLGVAVATKIAAGYAGAKLVGFNHEISLAIGFLMNGRGMVELVIASIGFAAGVIDLTLFSIAVAIGLVTSILAPVTSRPLVSKAKSRGSEAVEVKEPPNDQQHSAAWS
ncbi:putative Na(+)/H(+) antiporter [Candidatus Nitrososphaera gargensis Ga9.2]|uniref:Putative Na(+)/H(+) antiporter n=1 Tax=Nitrososphaera gargensis (strain Ga9.2) TaxID=1237085 RepID=K0IA91_NITGG|nr:cation:proton antiporter [Candidatus Nitrososphaera gargensis]AFU58241.1 putative Na(+)/H(+) antiporter [Candidatus Nitrososphaera gargensis Ga9.2]